MGFVPYALYSWGYSARTRSGNCMLKEIVVKSAVRGLMGNG